jgi:hypothetical protein
MGAVIKADREVDGHGFTWLSHCHAWVSSEGNNMVFVFPPDPRINSMGWWVCSIRFHEGETITGRNAVKKAFARAVEHLQMHPL